MHPLNPFLRAFFRSSLPSQCSPPHHHVLLVPTTDVLLHARDRESQAVYSDLAHTEDFLASHVLRVPGGHGISGSGKDNSFRDSRGKAKQFSTANGRTVIIKDNFVFSNKGFKTLNQVQLFADVIYRPDSFDAQPWLVYYISRPLIGLFEPIAIVPAIPPENKASAAAVPISPLSPASSTASTVAPRKKDVKTFGDLLNNFPMISRQMQPGLERLFKELGKEFEKPLPPDPPRPRPSTPKRQRSLSRSSLSSSIHSSLSNGISGFPSSIELDEEEDAMRRSLETAVTAAIDLFQMVDKTQLSLLGATTELTGPIVERMIERYVTEQIHDTALFPRISAIRKSDDSSLESRIRQMADVDISQVGVAVENGLQGKRQLELRIVRAVESFKKMGVASSPQEMMEILLATQKLVTTEQPLIGATGKTESENPSQPNSSEKQEDPLTVNADVLVSLLLLVVIRSGVRHLNARLSYMRHFIFIDDVESGELGYALSTFEAVISYLTTDASGLRRASKRNKRLWHAARTGNITEMKSVLEPEEEDWNDHSDADGPTLNGDGEATSRQASTVDDGDFTLHGTTPTKSSRRSSLRNGILQPGPLAHVFPFQRAPSPPPSGFSIHDLPIKRKKRVSMETNSISGSSGYSVHSRSDTVGSIGSVIEGDTSIETLCKTHNSSGDSVLMIATDGGSERALKYLLGLERYYPIETVLEDCNTEGTTLLSAAVQLGHMTAAGELLDFILEKSPSIKSTAEYMRRQDSRGRCFAHYLFNMPHLMVRVGSLIPWKLKDKNGQTPLFAMCRSYDHEEYVWMVETALAAAKEAQGDGNPLHLDEHIDGKGNTLLHIVNDASVVQRLLLKSDLDVNAANDKHFTPLMVASKYGRTDLVRLLFSDDRVDLSARDIRGLTAVELAKDDEVRNRIDDMVLLSQAGMATSRVTSVVRSFFVEDGTIRLVIKSGNPNDNETITVTTCRRSLADFENLARCLATEHPASWLPSIAGFPSPFLVPSRPSRAILRDIQLRLDGFLKTLMSHSTFSTHEMVWEFILVPDIDQNMLTERSKRKAEARAENVREDYTPITDVREVENFVQFARESVRGVHHSTKSVLRRTANMRHTQNDLQDAATMASSVLSTVPFLPPQHLTAFAGYTKTLAHAEASPLSQFHYAVQAVSASNLALLAALHRPATIIAQMGAAQKGIDRHALSLRRSDRWPLGLLDDARARIQRDAAEKMDRSVAEKDDLGRELRHAQQVVAGELAGWQEERVRWGRVAIRQMAKRMVVVEKDRLEAMKRAVRGLGLALDSDDGRPEKQRGRPRTRAAPD